MDIEQVQSLARAHGVFLPDYSLTVPQWDCLTELIANLPTPGTLVESVPRNMIDPKTRKSLPGIQYERGVDGWGVFASEHDTQVNLVRPEAWYLAQFRKDPYGLPLPYFVNFDGGRSSVQYNWTIQRTFLNPPLQSYLSSVDTMNLDGTWVKTRYKEKDDSLYLPTKVAVDLDYYSSSFTAEQARDHISGQSRLVFDFSQDGIDYYWARGADQAGKREPLPEGYTTIFMGRSNDIHRTPQQIDMYIEPVEDGVYFRINHGSFWQTEFRVPFSIEMPEPLDSSYPIDTETLDWWVDQHRAMF